ncbi:hypothetical protein AFR_08285 [Actinoplanes friuliensis DSM 7358]|uniref:Novel STAND NTPase 1 domain-containing protein n=1 Tax=Actinoplanes friuliensis DSM 7358 TaxID=1246995 RepID=U5VWA6_9ACTN|nr:hypothetical protein AFR_08285 [Actinoplanes friuliensis DSM 7358]
MDLSGGTEKGWEHLWQSLMRLGLDPLDDFPWDPQRPPYPGLSAFQESDSAVFFGRTTEVDNLLNCFQQRLSPSRQGVAIIGPSGSGKSSLLRAGLLPRLRKMSTEWIIVPPFRPTDGETPLSALARRINGLVPPSDQQGWRATSDLLNAEPTALLEISRDLIDYNGKADACVVIVIDQLEELITRASPDQRTRFGEAILAATYSGSPVWVVTTLRSEFLSRFLETPRFAEVVQRQILVGPMTSGRLQEVIEEPARKTGLTFDEGLKERMVEDTTGGDALPLLAYTLRRLYDQVQGRQVRRITDADYMAIGGRYAQAGGVIGVLMTYADQIVESLGPDGTLVVPTLLKMVNLDAHNQPTKRRVSRTEFRNGEERIVEAFVQQRLLTTDRADNGEVMVEVAHEALLRVWSPLETAINAARSDLLARSELERAARDWHVNKRRPSYGLQGERLVVADRLVSRGLVNLDHENLLADFLRASRRADAATRQRNSEQLAERVQGNLNEDPELSILLALAAIEDYGPTARAILALNSAVDKSRLRHSIHGHDGPMLSARYSPDGSRIVTSGEDGKARVWLLADTSEPETVFGAHTGIVGSADFSPDGRTVVSGSEDCTARVWSVGTGAEILRLTGHSGRVRHVAFCPCSEHVITASEDHTAKVWNMSGSVLSTFEGHTGIVLATDVSPDESLLVTASSDHSARVWDLWTGEQLRTLIGHEDWLRSPHFSPDGVRIATASEDGTARVWNASDGSCTEVLNGHSGRVRASVWSPTGDRLLTGSGDGTARVWDSKDFSEKVALRGHKNRVRDADFSPDGIHVVTASEDGIARVWTVEENPDQFVVARYRTRVRSACWSPSGSSLAIAKEDGSAEVVVLGELARRIKLEGHRTRVAKSIFSPDGTTVLTGSSDGTARVWDTASGECLMTIEAHADWIRDIALSHDGERLATASSDKSVSMWSLTTGEKIAELIGHQAPVLSVTFSPDGLHILTASADRTAKIWSIASSIEVLSLDGHGDWVRSANYSPLGDQVVTASEDATARVWDPSTGDSILVMDAHEDWVRSASFAPDGIRIVSASGDRTVRVWRATNGEQLHIFRQHTEMVGSATYDASGTRIVTASHDGTVRIFEDLSLDGLLSKARRRTFRNLTPEERAGYGLEIA